MWTIKNEQKTGQIQYSSITDKRHHDSLKSLCVFLQVVPSCSSCIFHFDFGINSCNVLLRGLFYQHQWKCQTSVHFNGLQFTSK